MLEEVVDADDHGEDQHHEGDGVTSASPREVLSDRRLFLPCLGLPSLGPTLLTTSLDLPLVPAMPAAARRTHRRIIRHSVGQIRGGLLLKLRSMR